jgi:hypothetical protein
VAPVLPSCASMARTIIESQSEYSISVPLFFDLTSDGFEELRYLQPLRCSRQFQMANYRIRKVRG